MLIMYGSTIIAILIYIPFVIWSASKPNTPLDYSVTCVSFLGIATPNFWIGLVLIMFFSVQLGWFPTGGVATLVSSFSIWDRLHHLILPALVLATADMPGFTRSTRSSMIEVLR